MLTNNKEKGCGGLFSLAPETGNMAEPSKDESQTEDEIDDEEWRFSLDDVGPEAATSEPVIEAESIDPENAFFFLLGVGLFIGLVVLVLL